MLELLLLIESQLVNVVNRWLTNSNCLISSALTQNVYELSGLPQYKCILKIGINNT